MRPANLHTKIFLDSGDPQETRDAIDLLGFLDGQTTNPTLISKNPKLMAQVATGQKLTREEAYGFYKKVVEDISPLMQSGSVSVEVYADSHTTVQQMVSEAHMMYSWIPNAHIKLPITHAGLEAAHVLSREGVRVNMTLCFNQKQAAAVYAATRGARQGSVYVSPFIGRLDDRHQNGLDLITNIQQMYDDSDHHVSVLAASVRTLEHLKFVLSRRVDIVTAPLSTYKKWRDEGFVVPDSQYDYPHGGLGDIIYDPIDLKHDWQSYDIQDELTDQGIDKFSHDWNGFVSG